MNSDKESMGTFGQKGFIKGSKGHNINMGMLKKQWYIPWPTEC